MTASLAGQFLGRPAPAGGHPLLTVGQRAVDEDHVVAEFAPTRLQQQGGVEDDGLEVGLGLVIVDAAEHFAGDFGMRDCFELLTPVAGGRIVSKHEAPDAGAVNFAVGGEDRVAPLLMHLGLHRRASQDFMTDGIRCNHGDIPLGCQAGRHMTLAGSDPPNEAHHRNCARDTHHAKGILAGRG
jgi:hypothetical protein